MPVVQPSGHRVRRKRALEARRGQRHRLARRVVPGKPGAGPQQRDKRNAANAKRLGQGALRVHVDAAKQSAHAALSALHAQPCVAGRTGRRAARERSGQTRCRRQRPRAQTRARRSCTGHTCNRERRAVSSGSAHEARRCCGRLGAGVARAQQACDAPSRVEGDHNGHVRQRSQQRRGVELCHRRVCGVRARDARQQSEEHSPAHLTLAARRRQPRRASMPLALSPKPQEGGRGARGDERASCTGASNNALPSRQHGGYGPA